VETPKRPSELADIFFSTCAFLGTSVVAFLETYRPTGFNLYAWCGAMIVIAGIPFALATVISRGRPTYFRPAFIIIWLLVSVSMFFGQQR
jgi:hypothetical protein